jgi:hypothetical protein
MAHHSTPPPLPSPFLTPCLSVKQLRRKPHGKYLRLTEGYSKNSTTRDKVCDKQPTLPSSTS